MKLEEMKRIAAARTPGKWEFDLYGCTAPSKGHYSKLQQLQDNAFIAMAANNWDKLMAVVDAAKNYGLLLDYGEKLDQYATRKSLRTALEALEED